jgi:hypothetical protein
MSEYVCASCGIGHRQVPLSWRMVRPDLEVPLEAFMFSRDGELCRVGTDCFILANIELPITGADQQFVWTCWVSLSQQSFERIHSLWERPDRESQEPAFGWLCSSLPTYDPSTLKLKTRVHIRSMGERPWVELECTNHPLAIEQREGISMERVAKIYHAFSDTPTEGTMRL